MSEKNILKLIKELGLTQGEVIDMINEKVGKDKELLTQEEKAEAEAAAKFKLEAKKKAEAKAKADAEKEKDKTPPEEPDTSIEKEIEKLKAEVEELKKSGKIPGKDPSDSKTLEKGALPETTVFTVQKNMFEVDI